MDVITGGAGFPTHGHRDMDIVSIVLSGGLEHKDSEGNVAVIRPGEVQRMSAGTGVTHSELNHYAEQKLSSCRFGSSPTNKAWHPYEQMALNPKVLGGELLPVLASPRGEHGGIGLHQDAWMLGGEVKAGVSVSYALKEGRLGYFHMPKGAVKVGGVDVKEGDGLYLAGPETLEFTAVEALVTCCCSTLTS